jgi:adenylosuccinate synthase
MPLQVIVGTQWGDEGKGRIVDWYAANAVYGARYNGGDNAGHTVTVGSHIFKLHLIPSGIIHPDLIAVLGSGMVVNPRTLFDEMDTLSTLGVSTLPDRLRISYAAHLITPSHQALDKAIEAARGSGNIGTTGRGIGPAYTDKATRRGLRMADMLSPDFSERVGDQVAQANLTLQMYSAAPLDPAPISARFREYAARLAAYICDPSVELAQALKSGRTVLAEAAQGTLLDLDFGTYPFVTSSSTTASGALAGLGLGLDAARDAVIVGVVKAFQTRVGSGPFPTELSGELAVRLRGTGANPWDEFGTTTGRPRRVGWLDGVLLRYAVRVNGINRLAVTKLDVLSGLGKVCLCKAYRRDGHSITDLPMGPADLNGYEPIYQEVDGWNEDLGNVRRWADLPAAARVYLEAVADMADVPIGLVSVGPERSQIVEID